MTAEHLRPVPDLVLDAVLHAAPVMVFAYDRDGTCTFSEGAGLSAVGLLPGEVVGVNLWDYYADSPHLVERMRRPLRGETFLETDRIGGRTFDTWFLPLSSDDDGVSAALGISVDVSDRTRAEEDLELYRAFVDAAPQFIALARVDGSVIYVNPGGRRLAGLPDDLDVTTTTIADYLTAEGLAVSIAVEQPAVVRDGRFEGETTLRHWPTGDGIPVRVASFLVTDPATGAPLALATVQSDLREVVAAREAVERQVHDQRGLLVHLHEAQEDERQRIAGEIHDDTIQIVAAVNLRLQSLRRRIEPLLPDGARTDLDALDRSVRDAGGRLRRLLVELDPPSHSGDDIAASLRAAVRSVVGDDGPTAEVDVQVTVEPSPIVGRIVLRIAQEALTNVVKHASASTVVVQLHELPGAYVLRVVDDGVGLAPGHDDPRPQHRGVRDMLKRADSVGGSFVLVDRAGGGTIAEAHLPHLLGHPEQAVSSGTSRMYLEQTMESISDAYIALDSQWRYVYVNRAAYRLIDRDPADSLVGKVLWEEFDIGPEFADAYRRARDEGVALEVTAYRPSLDKWIENRILPTGTGLSVFARDVTASRRQARLVETGRAVMTAVTRPVGRAAALQGAAEELVAGWPLHGLRVVGADGTVQAEAGEPASGPGRRLTLQVSGSTLGHAELFGEVDPMDDQLMQLVALRMAADPSTDASMERDDGAGVEPAWDPARSDGHGPDHA